MSPAAPALTAGGLHQPRRQCSESTCPWGCFGKAQLTLPWKAFPTYISRGQEWRPFPSKTAFFDATLCCGSLHLFADTVIALREIARVMKPGAILSVFTFGVGSGGILKFRRVREWSFRKQGLHVFDLPEMEQHLTASGFKEFQPELSGSILTFSARKQAS